MREAMAVMGYSISGRILEAVTCGVPAVGDRRGGLLTSWTLGEAIFLAGASQDAVAALEPPAAELAGFALAAPGWGFAERSSEAPAVELVAFMGKMAPLASFWQEETLAGVE